MCPHRHWFVDYKPMRGTIYLGDDKPLFVDGSGRVKLGMFDGVIRSIECWHVPGMKRNLISLSTLDSQGYKYHAEGGVSQGVQGLYGTHKRMLGEWAICFSRKRDYRRGRYNVRE